MTYLYVDVACEGALTTVTINRPEVHNALNAEAHDELEAIFNAFAARLFCAEHDL